MILKKIKHRGFHLVEMRPCKKKCVKIYKSTEIFSQTEERNKVVFQIFLQTSNNINDAKRLVDFCVDRGVWK